MDDAVRAGYRPTAADNTDVAPVDTEAIVLEELGKLGRPLPVPIAKAGPKGVDRAARRILRDEASRRSTRGRTG